MPRRTRALERRAAARLQAGTAVNAVPAVAAKLVQPKNVGQLQRQLDTSQQHQAELSDALQRSTSIGERAQTDVIAMTLGTTFHESLNLFIRWMAEASRKADGDASFWYRNVDLLQTLPGALGMATYLINTLSLHATESDLRAEKQIYLPPGWRIDLNESAKLLSALGLSHLFRALRYRWGDSIDELRDTSAVITEQRATLAKAQEEIAALKERIQKLQQRGS